MNPCTKRLALHALVHRADVRVGALGARGARKRIPFFK